jgi:hypothetical protein
MVSAVPNSLFKFPRDPRTRRDEPKTAAIASFVEVFPTLPVTATTVGRYRESVHDDKHRRMPRRVLTRKVFIFEKWKMEKLK